VDRFKLLLIGILELILQKLHGKTTIWSLQNYIIYINSENLCQYRKWLLVIVLCSYFNKSGQSNND
jgi:hypothetical protein